MYDTSEYFELVRRKDDIEKNFLDLGIHAKAIAEYLEKDSISSWFHIGWSIKGIDYDGMNRDGSFYYCRPSYEYEIANQDLYKRLVEEITFFTYAYSGLESYLNSLQLPDCPKRKGKINAATFFLKNKLYLGFSLDYYSELIVIGQKMYQLSMDDKYVIYNNQCNDTNGLGLSFIYKIRNSIMHGDFFFPEPLDYGSKIPFHPYIINICSRLILMSMQMLIYASENVSENKFKDFNGSVFFKSTLNPRYYCSEKCYDCDGDNCLFFSCNASSFLQNIHLKDVDLNVVQLKFDL